MRLTARGNESRYEIPAETILLENEICHGPAVERLAAFENLCEELTAKQDTLAAKLETLRAAGKKNSVQFRELFAEKLYNTAMLATLKAYGLLD